MGLDAKDQRIEIRYEVLRLGQLGRSSAAPLRGSRGAIRGRCDRVLLTMNTLVIYVHVPFCQTKCTYCNFHTGVVSSARFAPYVNCVCEEIARHREFYAAAGVVLPSGIAEAVVDTIYIGGGTPSLLDPAHLGRVVGAVRETFASELREVTLEADPETVTAEKTVAWVAAGINRVSFGVQSFCDEELQAAGRMHRRAGGFLRGGGFRGGGGGGDYFFFFFGGAHPRQGR